MRNQRKLSSKTFVSTTTIYFTLTFCLSAQLASQTLKVSKTTYHGWPDSLVLSNGKVEAVIVPAVGRVMQFHFVGEEDVFWENTALQGKPADPAAQEWINFGGDKTWPSPQADWQKMIGRAWPPPATFDSTPVQGSSKENVVELISPVDPAYGIRTHRDIELDSRKPVLKITTTYEKVSGDPVKVGIGVITQFRDPQRAFIVVRPQSEFPQGYILQNFDRPENITLKGGLLSLTRSHTNKSQIGSDSGTLLWMNKKYATKIESPYVVGAEYADQGSSTVIYTNSDPDAYVELETFGPLTLMKVGDKIERTNTYTLYKRSASNPEAEARKILRKS
jgi:hypothetical protein